MTDDADPDRRTELPPREAGISGALRELTDGVTDLVRSQFELLRLETKREATEAGSTAGKLAASAVVALFGYGLLLIAFVLGVGWWGYGPAGMAVCAATLGGLHVVGGLIGIRIYLAEFDEQDRRLEQKTSSEAEKWENNPEN